MDSVKRSELCKITRQACMAAKPNSIVCYEETFALQNTFVKSRTALKRQMLDIACFAATENSASINSQP